MQNVFPAEDGYRPVGDLAAQTDALTARCQGHGASVDTEGDVIQYAGDVSKLYHLLASAWTDGSKAGGYATPADGRWEILQFGDSHLVATNYADAIQFVSPGGTAFTDLLTSTLTPKCKTMGVVRDHLVLGYTNDAADGVVPNRIWWMAAGDPRDADPNAATLADYEDWEEDAGGGVQRIIGGVEYGLVFFPREILRMTFQGSPTIFRFDSIDRQRGTPIPGSAIAHGRLVGFISDQGFCIQDGVETHQIGDGFVDRTFWNQFDLVNASRVTAGFDPVEKNFLWGFPGSGNVGGIPNLIYCYNIAEKKWSEIEKDHDLIMRALTTGFTLDTLDTIGTDIDDTGPFPFSFDSSAYTGGLSRLAAFGTDKKLSYFSGDNLAATMETGDFQPNPAGLSTCQSLRPLITGGDTAVSGTITGSFASRIRQSDAVAFASAANLTTDGLATLFSNGRYHRAQVKVPAAAVWDRALGVQIEAALAGNK